ncbi:hypothetical protein ENSA5_05780 [Enhygromyxa salina]|uniref:Uncharacterized protein n=1 Tax=Enhygromyxa salina TaxID=215803 RepID=A0A2S9YHS9_9BACT|nr:hypothetical protein [Enhygromyxa salina]PRQ04664.1 hypothetical protein ENSA5_05780 [Enhygromyxa salina]
MSASSSTGKQGAGGLVLGLLLGAAGMYGVQTFVIAEPGECGGVCGEGTVCEAGSCRPAPLEVPDEAVEEPEREGKKGKRRRGRRGKKGGGDDAELASGQGPALDDDSKVPRFDPNKDQNISMSDGSGRLSDSQIDRELAKLDGSFQACVRDGAARVDELGSGRVSYKFGVDGKGKVTGVNASAPAKLAAAGILPCVRKAIYGHKFPAFDGPEMKVSASFTVD